MKLNHYLALVCLLALNLVFPAYAQNTDACQAFPDVTVGLTPHFDDPSYNYTVDLVELQALAHDPKRAVHSVHKGLILGLTRYNPFIGIQVSIQSMESSDGIACARADHVDIDFGYRDVTVYVPHEIPQGSCGFDEVVAHEQKHLAVNRQILDEYTPKIEGEIKEYLRLNGVFREPNNDYAIFLLKQSLQSIIDSMATEMFAENTHRQQLVDSSEEYRRISAACHGQLSDILHLFR